MLLFRSTVWTIHILYFFSAHLKDKKSPLKPDPTLLLEALDAIGSGLHESVYIGDQPSDVLTAYNASQVRNDGQMQIISVTAGFATRENWKQTTQPQITSSMIPPKSWKNWKSIKTNSI